MSQPRSKPIIALGKRLAAQLDDRDDLAAAWLSHLIAERITAAEAASGSGKQVAEQACVDLILELWRHRADFPDRLRPFRDLDAIMAALDLLSLQPNGHRYFREPMRAAEAAQLPPAANKWLELASGVDFTARLLLRLAFSSAIDEAEDGAAEWIELARKAAADDAPVGPVFVILHDQQSDPPEQLALNLRIERLQGFIALAQELANGLSERHQRARPPKSRPRH